MRHYPDDYGGVDPAMLDPLDRARLELDFEAMNANAPSVTQVLYKAQTMGPLAPVNGGQRFSWPAAALAVILIALLTPWMPIDTTLTVMQIGFEETLPRREASELAGHLLRSQPDNMLLGTQFTATDHRQGNNINGQLRIGLTAFNVGERELEQVYREQIRSYRGRGLDPMFRVEHQTSSRVFRSPVQQLERVLRPRSRGEAELPGSLDLERLIVGNGQLLAQALAPQLEAVEPRVQLREFEFVDPAAADDYDLTLPAWPRPVGLRVDNFQALTAGEQAVVADAAGAFIAQTNLTPPNVAIALPASAFLPLRVRVFDARGREDAALTLRVQAWVAQPSSADLSSPGYSPRQAVSRALEQVLPDTAHEILVDDQGGGDQRRFIAGVYLRPGGDNRAVEDARRVEQAAAEGDEHLVDW